MIILTLGTKIKEEAININKENKAMQIKFNNEGAGTGRGITWGSHLRRKGQIKYVKWRMQQI